MSELSMPEFSMSELSGIRLQLMLAHDRYARETARQLNTIDRAIVLILLVFFLATGSTFALMAT
jgi:septum formation topological specificity factor MinE